ncbi:amidase [Pseudomonas sp. Pseusp122]|uniref:amidase n=1 Tax=unclassified Pseudomonas TaxID=196821 RepID=UPI0039A4E3A4
MTVWHDDDLVRLSASEAAVLLQQRRLSAERLLQACLQRINQREPQVLAWCALNAEAALTQARALDAGPISGPLHGLPLAVKDLFDTRDFPSTYGSPIYAGQQPPADAAAVALCRQAGAIVLGKTVTTEFATFTPGPTRNPHNPAHTPGGSSSGSAAAVGAHMVPLALGTQTAASIIRPAAYCGVVGFKPGFGLIPRAGVKSLSESLDTIGGFGRSVADVALLTSVMADAPHWRELHMTGTPRIGLCRTPNWHAASAGSREALQLAADRLRQAGAEVIDVELPASFTPLAEVHDLIMWAEAFKALAHERLCHPHLLSDNLRQRLAIGEQIDFAQNRYNHARLAEARADLPGVFASCDLLLTPSALGEAESGLERTGDPLFSRAWSALGLPSVHLPTGVGPAGLPLGVQLIGPEGSDSDTLAFCHWAEQHLRE